MWGGLAVCGVVPQTRGQARRRLEGMVVEFLGVGAGQAEALAIAVDEAVEVDAFAAAGAGYALAFEAGELAGWEGDADPGFGE